MIWRTEDVELLRSLATPPRVWARIASDGLLPEDYEPLIHPRVHHLTDGRGFFTWCPLTTVCWEGHIVHLGGNAEAFAREACAWMFEHGAAKLALKVPRYNWHAIALARLVGFKCEGLLTSAVQWRGQLHDLVVMGMKHG